MYQIMWFAIRLLLLLVALFLPLMVESSSPGAQFTTQSLLEKVTTEKLPLFEFKTDLQRLLEQRPGGDLEIENVVNTYFDYLRDHYYSEFRNRTDSSSEQSVALFDTVMKECSAAMKSALPRNAPSSLGYKDQLDELQQDINTFMQIHSKDPVGGNRSSWVVSDASQGTTGQKKISEGRPLTANTKVLKRLVCKNWRRRSKWALSQFLLLALNFGQYELHRRTIRLAAEKRLAEVPEFPLF